jgi:hypothetical protein
MVRKRRYIDPRAAADGRLKGAASRMRDLVARRKDMTDVQERHRDEWPDLWEAIDSVVASIDTLFPQEPDPSPTLFDSYLTKLPPTRP